MKSKRISAIIEALLLVAMLQSSCNSQVKPSSQASQVNAESRQNPSDKDLLKQVETFASSDTNASAKALKVLDSYAHQNLIDDLTRLYGSTSPDDYHRVLIAFTLYKLGHENEANKRIVLSALSKHSPFERLYGDWTASLVHSILLGGDKEVLADLFAAAEWSDGAMSTELAGAYSDAIKNDPEGFLETLAPQSENNRRAVYALLKDNSLTKEERERVTVHLRSVSPTSQLHRTAQEAIKALQS
jgi:hypothetical protein